MEKRKGHLAAFRGQVEMQRQRLKERQGSSLEAECRALKEGTLDCATCNREAQDGGDRQTSVVTPMGVVSMVKNS